MRPELAAALARRCKRQVQAIKAAQRQLQLDDGTYRDLLERLTTQLDNAGAVLVPGKRSATQLTLAEGGLVLDYLRKQGATNPSRAGRDGGKRRPAPSHERSELLAKIHSLLDELGRVTGERHSLSYADAICKRNGWADAVDFCRPTDMHRVVGALSRTLRHRQAAQAQPAASSPRHRAP